MKSPHIHRRTLLQGLGAAAVGLPLLEEMVPTTALGAPVQKIPTRAFNVFFGLGIPSPLQTEGYQGVLEPLSPLKDKLLIMRNVDQVRCDENGINAHFDGASGAFTAEPPSGEAKSGGPSIDQVLRKTYHPNGTPVGTISTLVAGTFFRRSRVSRYVHSYNEDGTVAATMQERPRELFERIFGDEKRHSDEDAQSKHLRRSVLDAVVDQYRFFKGQRSPLGQVSRTRIAEHLEKIREYEQRAFGEAFDQSRPKAAIPDPSMIAHGGPADPGGEGIDITLDELTAEWRLMADLYALAIQMDRVHFGSLTFLAAGERIRLKGAYEYEGQHRFDFDDAKQLKASGSQGCSHEWWHKFNPKKENKQLRAHAHMKMREVAYFLTKLTEKDALESNGKTILENSLITISTESGDGRHNDTKRELSGVFHAITGANGRFKTGDIVDVGKEGIDVYNTILGAMGAKQQLGPSGRDQTEVGLIRT